MADREDLFELVDREHEPLPLRDARDRRASPASGARRDGATNWRQCLLPGSTPRASAGSRPACTTDDFPLPDGPMTPSIGAPTSRATSCATSCSRPKKYGASATSNEASPLNGHIDGLLLSVPDPVDALARGLERLDVVRKLGLDRAQVGAARRGAPGDRAHPSRGLAARPVAGDLVHPARHAPAHVEQPLVRDVIGRVRGRVEEGDLAHRGEVERLEHDRLVNAEVRERLLVVPGHEDENLAVRGCSQRLAQFGAHLGGRLVGVVQHEQRRALRLTGVGHRVEQRAAAAVGGQHRGATAVDGAGQLGGDPRLAAPATAGDREDRAAPGSGGVPALPQHGEPVVAPDQRRGSERVELGRELGRRRGIERRILAQDRGLQVPQLRPRLDADLVEQHPVRLAVGLERLGLATAAV